MARSRLPLGPMPGAFDRRTSFREDQYFNCERKLRTPWPSVELPMWFMWIFKARREAWREERRLRHKAKADPAIRGSWRWLYDTALVEVRARPHEPSTWRSAFEKCEGGPPCRQELEWWRAMCMLQHRYRMVDTMGLLPQVAAMVKAIDEMLPDAPDGPSDESYP